MSELIRIDKNIAHNIDLIIWLEGLTDEDRSIVKNLIYYFCISRQTDLFGYGTLDPKKFAKDQKYTEGYLRSKHSNPAQLSGLSESRIKEMYEEEKIFPERKIFDSKLENALYILHMFPLRLHRDAKEVVYEHNVTRYTQLSKSYILLPELKIITIHGRGSPKVLFNYSIDKKFLTNLSLYFTNFNNQSVIALRKTGLDDLYLYLKDLKDTLLEKVKRKQEIDRTLNFDFVCGLANVRLTKKDGSRFKNPRTIKQRLMDRLDLLNKDTELKFEVVWRKKETGNNKYSYVPHFYFDEVENYHHSSLNIVGSMNYKKERNAIFRENLIHFLIETYKNHNVNRESIESKMLQWLKSPDNLNEKDLAYRQAQYQSFGKLHKDIDIMVNSWLKELPRTISLEKIFI